jgi:hypothetical protein
MKNQNYQTNEIHQNLITLTKLERKTLAEILELLRLNFNQKIFAKMGYSHLVKYMVSELGYSESAAWRRWVALKITNEMPEAKKMLQDGDVNLSTLGKLSLHMKNESLDKKRAASAVIKNKTLNEVEKGLFAITGRKTETQDFIHRASENTQRMSVTLSDETVAKLDRLKQLMQKTKNDEVLNFALDSAIKKIMEKPIKQSKSSPLGRTARGILRHEVLKRDSHMCQYPGCDETKYLHLDHQVPYAKGGLTTSANLRVLCSTHNHIKGAGKS